MLSQCSIRGKLLLGIAMLFLIVAVLTFSSLRGVYAFRFRGDRFDCGSKLGFLQATVAFGLKDESVGAAFAETLYKGFSRSRRAA